MSAQDSLPQNTQSQTGANKLISLQVLRGFAAMLIVIFHAIHDVNGLYYKGQASAFGDPTYLIYGIDLFFVISGFIMVYTAYEQTGFHAAKGFMIRRIIRVVPIYWFFTVLLALALFAMPNALSYLDFNISEFLKSLFFVPYYDAAGGLYPFLKIGWTLNYEMYFYLVFALFMLLPSRFLMPALTIFFIATVFAKDALLPEGIIQQFYGNMIVINFLAGAWIGFTYKKGFRLPAWVVWFGFAMLAVSFIWLLNAREIYNQTDINFPRRIMAWITVALLVLPKNVETIRFPKWAVFMGNSSYSLYLAHSFAIGALVVMIGAFGMTSTLSPWLVFALCIIVSIIAGSLSYLLIEKPLLSVSKRLISSQK